MQQVSPLVRFTLPLHLTGSPAVLGEQQIITMRNSIFLSVFMLIGLFSAGQLSAQDAKACSKKAETECLKSVKACSPADEVSTVTVSAQPLIIQAAMNTSPSATPASKPANCQPATTASANCDPSLCTKLCDPKDCPPECRKLCGKSTSVAEKSEVKEVNCKPAPAKSKVAIAAGS